MQNFGKLVDAVNFLNEYIPIIVDEVKTQLDPHIGKPIFKSDGSWRKSVNWKYKPIKKQLPNGDWLDVSYYVRQQMGYIDLNINLCLNGGSYDVHPTTGFTIYQKQSLVIYTVDSCDFFSRWDGNIVDFNIDLEQYNVRYTVESILQQAEIVKTEAIKFGSQVDKIPFRFRDALYLPTLR